MKKNVKVLTCGTTALIVAVLGLNAQSTGSTTSSGASTSSAGSTSAGSSISSPSSPTGSAGTSSTTGSSTLGTSATGGTTQYGSPQTGSTGSATAVPGSTSSTSGTPGATPTQPGTGMSTTGTATPGSSSMSTAGSASSSGSVYGTPGINSGTTTTSPFPSVTFPTPGTSTTTGSQTGTQTGTSVYGDQASSSSSVPGQTSSGGGSVVSSTNAQAETQITTIVQQLDRQGPAVVQRISSQLGNLVCSQDTVQNLVAALHNGESVTLTSNVNGQAQSATFSPTGKRLGYGEAFIALSLAAEQLRNAGVSGCATPDQWKAVLLGGPLAVNQSSSGTNSYASASSSTTVPGIITLRSQGQGWGQIAQSANVQLGQIVSNASVSGFSSVNTLDPNAAGAPTGQSSADFNRGPSASSASDSTTIRHDNGKHKGQHKDEWFGDRNQNRNQRRDQNRNDGSPMNPSNEPATDTGTADSTRGSAQPTR